MFIGYIRMSKADGSQTNDLQRDALIAAGVDAAHFMRTGHRANEKSVLDLQPV